MKTKIIFFLLFVQISAYADEECAANTSQYNAAGLKKRVPIFVSNAKNIAKILPSTMDKTSFTDSAVMKDGTQVVYTEGGCAYFAYSFTFKGKAIQNVKDSEKVNRASTLLKVLEVNENSKKKLLLESLAQVKKNKKATFADGLLSLPCGDANCELVDKNNNEVVIGYDFSL